MYTCYFDYGVQSYLHNRGLELHRKFKSCCSMFAFNKETNTVYIYTTHPGLWIGPAGRDINKIKTDISKMMFPHPIDVAIIETRM